MAIPAAPAEIAELSLSAADVTDGIRNLSDGEQIKFKRASQYLGGAGARPPADLRHEAIRRAIAGSRKCPRHLPVVAFLIGTMRSIAHADRKALNRASKTLILADPSSSTILDATDPRISPEEVILRTEEMAEMKARVLQLFEDDATAHDIVEARFIRMEGKDLQELVGLSEKELATKNRLIRRRIDKAFPDGWKP
jgi:hypothetical protein